MTAARAAAWRATVVAVAQDIDTQAITTVLVGGARAMAATITAAAQASFTKVAGLIAGPAIVLVRRKVDTLTDAVVQAGRATNWRDIAAVNGAALGQKASLVADTLDTVAEAAGIGATALAGHVLGAAEHKAGVLGRILTVDV